MSTVAKANLLIPSAVFQSAGATLGARCSLLIPSCDAYADLWLPFMTLFWRRWPDCPFPVYLGSNQQTFEHPRVTTIYAGHGHNWTNRVREQLATLDTSYVLLMLEDFFLRRPVNTVQVVSCFEALLKLQGTMLRLTRRPSPDLPVASFPLIGQIKPGAPYRVSTQATIWHRQTLLNLMREGETIWQFEMHGSRRSDRMRDGFYSVWRSILPYDHHVIERGKWFRHEARRFGRMGIGCDFSRRPIMTRWEMVRWSFHKARSCLLELIPWEQRQPLVHFLRRLAALGKRSRTVKIGC
jgi:hypothetical protein